LGANGPAKERNAPANEAAKAPPAKARARACVSSQHRILQGSAKVYESKPVVANEVTAPDRKAVIFQIDLPLQALKQDSTCASQRVDDVRNFAFPRSPSGQRACAAE